LRRHPERFQAKACPLKRKPAADLIRAETGSREDNASNKNLEHDPEKHALGLDPRVVTGFPKRSCSNKKMERDDEVIAL
jgi:hypothetical protein